MAARVRGVAKRVNQDTQEGRRLDAARLRQLRVIRRRAEDRMLQGKGNCVCGTVLKIRPAPGEVCHTLHITMSNISDLSKPNSKSVTKPTFDGRNRARETM